MALPHTEFEPQNSDALPNGIFQVRLCMAGPATCNTSAPKMLISDESIN